MACGKTTNLAEVLKMPPLWYSKKIADRFYARALIKIV